MRLAKIRLSPNVTQPTFSGRGWDEAERMVKDPSAEGVLRVEEHDGPCEGSFEGFECRWQGVPSFNDHKLALLVAAMSDDADVNLASYRQLSDKIAQDLWRHRELPPVARRAHAAVVQSARARPRVARAFEPARSLGRVRYFARMVLLNLAGVYLFARRMDTSTVRWSQYIDDMVENSDFRKFDGMLRMVMDGSEAQYEDLRSYLEGQRREGRLVYGMHKSSEALVTCIVFSYNGNHVHFVDGSDGGYAMAARGLKAQLKSLAG